MPRVSLLCAVALAAVLATGCDNVSDDDVVVRVDDTTLEVTLLDVSQADGKVQKGTSL